LTGYEDDVGIFDVLDSRGVKPLQLHSNGFPIFTV